MKRFKTAWLAALVLLALGGCGGDGRTLVVVHVGGDRSGFARVLAGAMLDDVVSMDVQLFETGVQDFGLLLPQGARGTLLVLVSGYSSSSQPLRCGIATTEISGQSQVDVMVTLTSAGCD